MSRTHKLINTAVTRLDGLLHRVFGEYEHRYSQKGRFAGDRVIKERRARVHWSNDSSSSPDDPTAPLSGRIFLDISPRGHRTKTVCVTWAFAWDWVFNACVRVEPGCDSDVSVGFGVIPLRVWVGVDGLLPQQFATWWEKTYGWQGREVWVYGTVPDPRISWSLWVSPNEWSSATPKWRDGGVGLADVFLGETQVSERVLSTHKVKIPLPEGGYDATVTLKEKTISRPRWPATRLRCADVEVPIGIPFEGKGESPWNCGEDATYALHGPADNLETAIARMVESVLNRRRRYNGNIMAAYPSPEERQRRVDERQRQQAP